VGPIPEGFYSWQCKGVKPSQFATFKRQSFEKAGGITDWFLKARDYDTYFKLEEVGPIHFVDKSLLFYRIHSTNISQNENRSWAKQFGFAAFAMVHVRGNVPEKSLRSMTIPKIQLVWVFF
jgi:hypothetical protein